LTVFNINTYFASPDTQEQILDILISYFDKAAAHHPEPDEAGTTTYFSTVTVSFVHESAYALINLEPTSPLFSRHHNLLQNLAIRLRDLPDDLTTPPPDYLFFSSFTYGYWLLEWNSDIIKTETGRDFIVTLLKYRARIHQPRKDIEVIFCDPENSYTTNWLQFVEKAGASGVVLSQLAEERPIDSMTIDGAKIAEGSSREAGDATIDVDVLGAQPSYGDTVIHSPSRTGIDEAKRSNLQ